AVLFDHRETTAVTTGQQPVFSARTIAPDRADGVDHEAGGKPIALRNFCLAGCATTQRTAFLEQLQSSRTMTRPIHAAAPQHPGVCRIDDGVNLLPRDVAFHDGEAIWRR